VLKQAGLLSRWKVKPSRKGSGFEQPLQPHQQWHMDVSYINVCDTFYCLCSVLDGYSRFIVRWDLRESMNATDIDVILQRAKGKYPEQSHELFLTMDRSSSLVTSRIHSHLGYDASRTSPYYPQSTGKSSAGTGR
jgi:transposase InsO family protein